MKISSSLAVLLLAGSLAFSEEPQGSYSYDFSSDTGSQLWNLEGDYSTDFFSFTLEQQDGWGRLWSSNRFVGAVTGSSPAPRVRLSLRESTTEDDPANSGTIRTDKRGFLSLRVDPSALALTGTEFVFQRQWEFFHFFTDFLGVDSHQESVTLPLADGNDGQWNLALNVTPNGNWLNGDATITFANGATASFYIRGRYNPVTDKSRLLLFGTGPSRGAYLQLNLDGAAQEIDRMQGRVSGQFVNYRPPV